MVTALAGPGSVAGGVWQVVVNQAEALTDAGYTVSIVAGWLGTDPPAELRGLPVHLVPVRSPAPGLGLRALVGRGWTDAVTAAVEGADIAHVHLCRDLLTTRAARTIRRLGTPIVAQPHGMLTPPRSMGFQLFDAAVTGPALRCVQRFIALDDREKPFLQGLGIAAEDIVTIQNAVPDPMARWKPVAPTRLLFASRLHPRKQVMVFAEAVARLRAEGYAVEGIVAGPDQGDLPRLERFIRDGGHARHLRYVGELTPRQLINELEVATAFVFPALDEPFGLVVIEALSVGTPTVSTTQTPLAEAMSATGAALVTQPTTEDVAAAIAQLLSDVGLQRSLSVNGRALYESQWTLDAMMKELVELYRDVARADKLS